MGFMRCCTRAPVGKVGYLGHELCFFSSRFWRVGCAVEEIVVADDMSRYRVIGTSGSGFASGTKSSQAHLHFLVLEKGNRG